MRSTSTLDGHKRKPAKGLRRACWECETTISRLLLFLEDNSLILTAGKKQKTHRSSSQTDASSVRSSLNSSGPDRVDDYSTCQVHIGERLCKLEQLFERFVCRKSSNIGASSELARSPTLVDQGESEPKFGSSTVSNDVRSISSIGEGIVSRMNLRASCSLTILTEIVGRADMDISPFNPHARQ